VFLSRLLDGWGVPDDTIDDASLLATELLSNAVRHGSGAVTLRVEVEEGVVQVRVHDEAPGVPALKEADSTSLGGRGLFIVQCVAETWGSDPDDPDDPDHPGDPGDPGKTVWFRLHPPPEEEDSPGRGEDHPT
jgi:signal transduction histidine kinase